MGEPERRLEVSGVDVVAGRVVVHRPVDALVIRVSPGE
jgi:hypothetical protein